MKWQVNKSAHVRYHLLFEFNGNVKAVEVPRKICAMYAKGAMPQSATRHLFSRFKSGNLDLRTDHTPID